MQLSEISWLKDSEKIVALCFSHRNGKKYNNLESFIDKEYEKMQLGPEKISRVHIRSNGRYVTGLQLYTL